MREEEGGDEESRICVERAQRCSHVLIIKDDGSSLCPPGQEADVTSFA